MDGADHGGTGSDSRADPYQDKQCEHEGGDDREGSVTGYA